ncbi:MAG: fumarate hydratase [Candidatus Omnitrophota bacterium]
MRNLSAQKISETVRDLCIEANTVLRGDVLEALTRAARRERSTKARGILKILIENAAAARRQRLAICQDTGVACVYAEIGQDVHIAGGDLEKAINEGVRLGYRQGYFRDSIVDPLTRKNTGDNTPAVIHTRIAAGGKVRLTVIPKGFGCENKNQVKMFRPTAARGEVIDFIVEVVRVAGPDACPPFVIGVGIGGTMEKAVELSKEALLKKVTGQKQKNKSVNQMRLLEKELLRRINKLGIGPSGLGGETTALAVNVLTHPTHIAGLPVAVSIGCHAMRSATKVL